jgi:hypothetical protein
MYGSLPLRPDRGWVRKPEEPPPRWSDWSPGSPSPNGSGWNEWRGRRTPTASLRTCVKRACRSRIRSVGASLFGPDFRKRSCLASPPFGLRFLTHMLAPQFEGHSTSAWGVSKNDDPANGAGQSGFAPDNLTTLAHFSVSLGKALAKEGEPALISSSCFFDDLNCAVKLRRTDRSEFDQPSGNPALRSPSKRCSASSGFL